MASVTWGPVKVAKVVTLALYVISKEDWVVVVVVVVVVISKEDWLGCCG